MLHPIKQNMNRNIPILGFLILFGLISCEKDNNILPSGIYLKKVYYHKNADQVRLFDYTPKGILAQRDYQFIDVIGERFVFIREDNKTSILYYSVKSPNDHSLIYEQRLDISYENEKIVKTIFYSSDIVFEVLFYYGDNDDRITKIKYERLSDNTEMIIEEIFDYDNKGNITRINELRDGKLWSTSVYDYDPQKNPYYLVDPINNSFSKIDMISYLSPNNPIRYIYMYPDNDTLSTTLFHYEYNSDGFPRFSYESIDSKYDVNDYDSTGTKYYEYEIK
jgi:hypothetical protein